MASFACARRPVHKIIPYVVKPEEITPGVANFYASTDPETGYGLLIKTREALFEPARAQIRALHSYETPEIVALPVAAGDGDYLAWLAGTTRA